MDWVTVYDVGTGNSPAGSMSGTVLFCLVFGLPGALLIFIGTTTKMRVLGGVFLFGCIGTLVIGLAGHDYYGKQRNDLAHGAAIDIDGIVSNVSLRRAGHGTSVWFQVQHNWFILPEFYPANCQPRVGEELRIATEPAAIGVVDGQAWFPVMRLQVPRGSCDSAARSSIRK